jgi:hypothetical protein
VRGRSCRPQRLAVHTGHWVAPGHTYRLAIALAAHDVPHTVHVFAHGPHSLGLAHNADDASSWTALAAGWILEQAS